MVSKNKEGTDQKIQKGADHSHLKRYSKKLSRKAAQNREKDKQESAKGIDKISKEELKLIGASLYWAEGNNKNRNRFSFSNSDPKMIKVIMKFLRKICEVPDGKIKARIHLYPNINQKEALEYWNNITDLPKENFHPPQVQVSRASKGKRDSNTLPHGTLHLTVNDTELASKVKGLIRGITQQA